MMSTAGRIRTRKEKPALAHVGFMYRFDRHSVDDDKFWRCLRDRCLGRIKTDKNDVFVELGHRIHDGGVAQLDRTWLAVDISGSH